MNQLFSRKFFLCICLSIASNYTYAQHSMDNIVELLNNRELTTARKLLSENIVHDTDDLDSRLLLGSLTDYFGETEDAIKIWSAGIKNSEEDYPIYINIGEIRLRQGLKGMNIKYKKGRMEVVQEADSTEDSQFKNSMLKLASEAFEKAHLLHPYEDEPLINLGKLFNHTKEYEKALIYWERLSNIFPSHEEYLVKAVNTALNARNLDKALVFYNKALELNKFYAPVYDGLSDYWLILDKAEEAELATRKGAFYNWLPTFCEMEYSPESYKVFELINFGGEKLDAKEKTKEIRRLINDKTKISTKFLAAIAYYHNIHEDLEDAIFAELAQRDTYSHFMLVEVARNSEYLCAINHALNKLMEIKPAGTLALLIDLIPKDQHETETIRVADHLASLGNEQAVLHLVELLNVDFQTSNEAKADNIGERKARQRAALALASFPNPKVVDILEKGIENTDISYHCAASLYKITLDEKYLTMIQSAKGKDENLAYFLKQINTKEAQKLAKKLG